MPRGPQRNTRHRWGRQVVRGSAPRVTGMPPRRRGGRDHRVHGDCRARNTPHRRGGLDRELDVPRVVRNAPASAGRPMPGRLAMTHQAERPRVGGEDAANIPHPKDAPGTSPRRRGRRVLKLGPSRLDRNTLASAGRTLRSAPATRPTAEHPRVGGEDGYDQLTHELVCGTPPRRRGGRAAPTSIRSRCRNTPASAGRTRPCGGPGSSCTEHPRVGGEDASAPGAQLDQHGTLPRRRGGPRTAVGTAGAPRNTPTSAGRTAFPYHRSHRASEHPHVGGEDDWDTEDESLEDGTPPRRRGGPRPRRLRRRQPRNTPTSAGRTAAAPGSDRSDSEHPHVGGEDRISYGSMLRIDGTPPRRRGGRDSR